MQPDLFDGFEDQVIDLGHNGPVWFTPSDEDRAA